MSNNRDDFTEKTKDLLAKRVGYRCSNPKCGKLTCGATRKPDGYVNIGVAAHICAAAPGGKRYDRAMSHEERKSILNGIWLCQSCSKLIDSDEIEFTEELLHEWKYCAEMKATQQLQREQKTELENGQSKHVLHDAFDELRINPEYSEYLRFLNLLDKEIDETVSRMKAIQVELEAAKAENDNFWIRVYEQRMDSLNSLYIHMLHQMRILIDERKQTEQYVKMLNCYASGSFHSHYSRFDIDTTPRIDKSVIARIEEIIVRFMEVNSMIGEARIGVCKMNLDRIHYEKALTDMRKGIL